MTARLALTGLLGFLFTYICCRLAGKVSEYRFRKDIQKSMDEFKAEIDKLRPCGHWIEDHMNVICSHCETVFSDQIDFIDKTHDCRPIFCPYCGAIMIKLQNGEE